MLTQVASRRAMSSSEISTACCSVPTEVMTTVISSRRVMLETLSKSAVTVKNEATCRDLQYRRRRPTTMP